MMNIRYNHFWDNAKPDVSVVTACYNRKAELPKAMESIRHQSHKNIEYIIVDDGSSENESVDDIVLAYMDSVDFPVAFIKKENGGVHTARNAGFRICRGQYCMYLDSDDEYLPNCIEIMLDGWASVPPDRYYEYREVNAYSMHEGKIRRKGRFPKDINLLPYEKAKALQSRLRAGDKIGMFRADLM